MYDPKDIELWVHEHPRFDSGALSGPKEYFERLAFNTIQQAVHNQGLLDWNLMRPISWEYRAIALSGWKIVIRGQELDIHALDLMMKAEVAVWWSTHPRNVWGHSVVEHDLLDNPSVIWMNQWLEWYQLISEDVRFVTYALNGVPISGAREMLNSDVDYSLAKDVLQAIG